MIGNVVFCGETFFAVVKKKKRGDLLAEVDTIILPGLANPIAPLPNDVLVAIQREIEMVGIPTALITLLPENSRPAGPPRAIAPQKFKLGDYLGGPHQNDLQRKVLLDALRSWEAREEPGHIREIDYPEYGSSQWQPINLQEG